MRGFAGFLRVALLAVCLSMGAVAPAVTAEQAAPVRVTDAEKSVVRVIVLLYDENNQYIAASIGSGFVVAPGKVVTNNHVVAGAAGVRYRQIFLVPNPAVGNARVSAEIIQTSAEMDLALLSAPDLRAPPLRIAGVWPDKEATVHALGFPGITDRILNRTAQDMLTPSEPTVTAGSIALFSDRAPGGARIETVFHTAFINPGNSGGPLIDACGRVIGVNTWSGSAVMNEEGGLAVPQGQFIASRANVLSRFLRDVGVDVESVRDACIPPLDARVQELLERQQQELARAEARRKAADEQAERAQRGQQLTMIIVTVIGVLAILGLGAAFLIMRHRETDLSVGVVQTADATDLGGSLRPPPGRRPPTLLLVGLGLGAVLVVGGGILALNVSSILFGRSPPPKADSLPAADLRGVYHLTCEPQTDTADPITLDFDADLHCINDQTALERVADGYERYTVNRQARRISRLRLSADLRTYRRDVYRPDAEAFDAIAGNGAAPACATDNVTLGQISSRLARLRALAEDKLDEPTRVLRWACRPVPAAAASAAPADAPPAGPTAPDLSPPNNAPDLAPADAGPRDTGPGDAAPTSPRDNVPRSQQNPGAAPPSAAPRPAAPAVRPPRPSSRPTPPPRPSRPRPPSDDANNPGQSMSDG